MMRKMRTVRGVALVIGIASALAIGGCGGGGGGCGDPASVGGNWSGTVADRNCGNGTLDVTFAQDGCSVDGVWATDFAVPACDAFGSLRGSVTKDSLDATLDATGQGCSLDVNGVVDGVNQISGNFTPHGDCQVNGGGTFSITRTSPVTPTPSVTATPSPTPSPTP
jgi:hypothetical protein